LKVTELSVGVLVEYLHITIIIINVFASSVVDGSFKSLSGLTKDYKIDIVCLSA